MKTNRSRTLAFLLAMLTALMITGGSVSAHAEYESSVPAADSTVATAPTQVVVKFSEELTAEGNELAVTDAAGARVDTGGTTLDKSDADRKTLVVALKAGLANGTYKVAWKNSSTDGHSEEGSFNFSIGTATSAPATLPNTSSGDSTPLVLFLVSALAMIGAGLVMRRSPLL
jgi:methionine-rich copper-binding protein CopC